ncbi:MAG: cytochrome c biogenesis protein CcsA [Verrucomicrobiota bacterium]
MKKYIPHIALALGILITLSGLFKNASKGEFDVAAFAKLPVQSGGRVLPLDSIARNSLRVLQGKTTVKTSDGEKVTADQWLLDLAFKPSVADDYPVFRIDNPDVLGLFGWEQKDRKYFSWNELEPHFTIIDQQTRQVPEEPKQRNAFDKALLKLANSLMFYNQIGTSFDPGPEYAVWPQIAIPGAEEFGRRERGETYNEEVLVPFLSLAQYYMRISGTAKLGIAPPPENAENPEAWLNIGEALLETIRTGELNPVVGGYGNMGTAYIDGDAAAFLSEAEELQTLLEPDYDTGRVGFEQFFNRLEPFYQASIIYVIIMLLVAVYWLNGSSTLQKSAFWLLCWAFAVHTFALFARMYIQERPPVTNLYSSAIFVGWVAIILGIVLEKIGKNGLGSFVSALVGFSTLVIAHNLSLSGDTLEMMQAVLDSNFWLATHVIIITAGYSAVFLAGGLGILYVIGGVLTPGITKDMASTLYRMCYGITCFGILFSFVGTMLGGIWADQSWGRFWGWDPKENGALLIVLWGALMLHARWGGLVKARGFMLLAIFGNIITAWSWFGTNMLGIGLHSYGFMDAAFRWLMIFWFSQVLVIAIGLTPIKFWGSKLTKS